ncbi:MAG: S-layer homology domain-containing protein [Candidatus Saganbacteria bacterium]|nr:S-layer homology domain-containing protein [Candidatus Saganbacteria bacterium]
MFLIRTSYKQGLTVFAVLFLLFCLQLASFAATKVANDPTRIGVGARILGMGKAYIGLSDDLNGIFINPASLATVDKWQATSMQGKFINEYNYLNLGTAVPTQYGNFGVGYVGSNISFTAPAATTEVVDGVRIIPSTTEGVSYSFLDAVMLFSWGKDLKGLLGKNWFDDVTAGATIKIFALDLSGPGISQGKASGTELDLGVTYQPNPMFKAGLVLANALPATAGGKIKWDNGTEETLPSMLKPGISIRLLGEEGWQKLGGHEVSLNLDGDIAWLRPEIPYLWHLGLEWWPIELLAIRAGIDQDYVGSGTGIGLDPTNNLTAGVGLLIGQFRFDYAYHQYNQVTDNDTHYFSLTYGVGPEPEPEKELPSFSLLPPDRTVVFTSEVTVKGTVNNKKIEEVTVKATPVPLAAGDFRAIVPLELGKNLIVIQGFRSLQMIDSDKIRVLRLLDFRDVAPDYWAAKPIAILAMDGIISGYPDGTFRPDGLITRAEFTKLLMSARGIGDFSPSGKPYVDIRQDHWAADYIGFGAKYGFVKGYPDRTFRPNNPVTRAEGVSMIARFADLPEPRNVEVPFSDVPGRYWAANDIIRAKQAGILNYLTGALFEPQQPLTRAEVAEMLSRTPPLNAKVEEILDWNKGY